MSSASTIGSTFYDEKLKRSPEAKYAVALRAVLMLNEGDSILIDAGTSLTPIAQIIRVLGDKYSKRTHFTIMTHNRAAFDSLIDVSSDARLNIFQTGGRFDRDLNASFGHQAESAYENYHPKWVFVGQSGIDADRGLFCHGNTEELSLKTIISSKPAFCRVIISDFAKLGVPGGLCFGTSDRLTDNVEYCILLTNEPHDEFEKVGYSTESRTEKDRKRCYERYERQVSILSDTYKVIIIPVKYTVEVDDSKENTITIGLRPADHPVDCPEWMGIKEAEGPNKVVITQTGDGWTVTDVQIHTYSQESQDSAASHRGEA